jgi:hypothetical protein
MLLASSKLPSISDGHSEMASNPGGLSGLGDLSTRGVGKDGLDEGLGKDCLGKFFGKLSYMSVFFQRNRTLAWSFVGYFLVSCLVCFKALPIIDEDFGDVVYFTVVTLWYVHSVVLLGTPARLPG